MKQITQPKKIYMVVAFSPDRPKISRHILRDGTQVRKVREDLYKKAHAATWPQPR